MYNVSKSFGSEINEVVRRKWSEQTIVSCKCAASNIQTVKSAGDDNERREEQQDGHRSCLFTEEAEMELVIDL